VHAGIRRAQCFRCDTVLGIEEVVALLPPPPPAEPLPLAAHLPSSLTLGDPEGAEDGIRGRRKASAGRGHRRHHVGPGGACETETFDLHFSCVLERRPKGETFVLGIELVP
jgi:hypothetical protein